MNPVHRRLAPCTTAAALVASCAVSLFLLGCSTTENHAAGSAPNGLLDAGYGARLVRNNPARADGAIAGLLQSKGEHVQEFHSHVVTLSNYFFEGRAPGTAGGEIAAQYLEFYFRRYGLGPVFDEEIETPGGQTVLTPGASYQQVFTVAGDTIVTAEEVAWSADGRTRTLTAGEDFNVLGVSGNAEVSGPLTFVGYSIPAGPGGYSSYPDDVNLEGRIAVVLRYEPITEAGKSRWSTRDTGWSNYAALSPKLQAAADKGAAGVILVSPPGADDPRAARLETVSSTRIGGAMDVPVIMMTTEAVDELIRAADADGRSLYDLRRMADEGAAIVHLDSAEITIDAGVERLRTPTTNVAGLLPGRGDLADEFIVIGGHYDHVGYGHFGSRWGARGAGHIHPGADDNASGTAGVLLLARVLSKMYAELPEDQPVRSIVFMGFGAEESGLNGSRYFVQNPPMSIGGISNVVAMINMDMIGRLREGALSLGGTGTAIGFEDWLAPYLAESGLNVTTSRGGTGPSDHASFYNAGVPVLFAFTGLHTEYHTPDDKAHTINYAGGVAISALVGRIAMALATEPERLVFQSTGTRTQAGTLRGVSVQLGIVPGDYSDDRPGVMLGGVTPGTSADDAGLKAGDRILRWGGEEVADIGAMMQRLADHKPGDVVTIVIERDGEEMSVDVTLKPRAGRQ